MQENSEQSGPGREERDAHPHGPIVMITVDSQEKEVHRGSWVVQDLKAAVGIDPSRVLDQVINGEFKPLDDNERITIKGGEVFVSHVRQGGAA